MTNEAVAVALTLTGATCEIIGIILVVREIVADRRLARVVVEQRARPAAPPSEQPTEWDGPISRFLKIDWDAVTQVNKKEFQRALDQAIYRLIEADRERDHAVRDLLNRQLAGSIGGRVAGVAFFGVGVLVATSSQVLQLLGR